MSAGLDAAARLQTLHTPAQQCEYLLRLGLQTPEQPSLRSASHRIPGCQTPLWIAVECRSGIVHWQADSGSALVRGLLALFHERYDGRTLEEIRCDPPDFLHHISGEILSPELRRNGLTACYRRIACLTTDKDIEQKNKK